MVQLVKRNIQDIVALTPMQQGMLFHYLKDPGSDLYFEQLCLNMSGAIDIQIFEQAWNMVVETNEMLRTVFRWQKVEEPVQMVLKEHRPDLRYVDLTDSSQQGHGVEEITAQDREERFDLQQPAFRVSLCKSAEDRYAMIISHHHILYDGWSNGIILEEFFDAYHHLLNGKKWLRTAKTRFKEFVRYLKHQPRNHREKFWTDYLAGFDTRSELSVKRKREGRSPGRGETFDTYRMKCEDEESRRLAAFVGSRKVTLATLFYGAWAILLQRYNNSRDVMFGATVSGRSVGIEGIENMVGLFINTLPLRVQRGADEHLEHQLHRIEGTWQEMEAYAHTPLVDIKAYSEIEGSKEPVDSLLVVENYPLDSRLTRPGKLSVAAYSLFERPHYDLTVGITPFKDFECTFIYNKEAFDGETVERLARHYRLILESILKNPGGNVSEVDMLSEEERRQILTGFNHTDDDCAGSDTIQRLFAERAQEIPDRTAILYADRQLSYRRLNERAAQLAGAIGSRGVEADNPVAMMMERSLEMVVGVLAILKAGAAYLPIFPDCPPERAAFMLQDSGVQLLVTRQPYKEHIGDISDLEVLDPQDTGLYRETGRHLDKRESRPRDLAYVMYTSGSTGRPKGVMVSHGSLVNVLSVLQKRYPVETADTYLFKTAYGFDVSVTELFGWFWGGGRLVVLERGGESDPRKIVETVEMTAVTHINFVPSMFNAFVESLCPADVHRLSSLKYIFLAGEALLPESVHKFNRLKTTIALENLYGPTEATVYASGFSLRHWHPPGPVPIGRPLANMKIYILNMDDHLQPIGVPGELCIAGVGLARGYLNNPGLTAQKFINLAAKTREDTRSPKDEIPTPKSQPLYKTGDLARFLPDGNIEFLGRIDQQVKIRGFRIELGEIESQLLTHPRITGAVAAVREDQGESGDRYLCAYFTCCGDDSLEATDIKEYLSSRLPDYMIPLFFVQLAEIPLSASGKVNRPALPAPHMDGRGEEYTAPRHAVDEGLVEIWSELLGVARESVGIDGNFFKMGGHSLKAVKLMSRIHKVFHVRLPLSRLFTYPSIRGLADYIEEAGREHYASLEKAEKKEYYPLSSAQMRLYVLHESREVAATYNISLAFRLEGKLEIARIKQAFALLALRHESLRTAVIVSAGRPGQRVWEDIDFELEYVDLTEAGEQPVPEVVSRDFIRPFDLSAAPLWRVGLVKLSADRYLLLWDMHHMVADGSSIGILLQELGQLYAGTGLPGLRFQYRDYVRWQTHFFETRLFERQEAYWLAQFADNIPRLHLPLDFERPEQQTFGGETLAFDLTPETAGKLALLARQENATTHMVFFALYTLLLSRYSRQEDIVVGSLVAGRHHPDLEPMVGMFANFLPVRVQIRGEWTFREFLGQVKKSMLGAYENQGYPFEKIPDLLAVPLDWARNPLFDTMVIYHNELESNMSLEWPGGVRLQHHRLNKETSRLDLLLDVFPDISGALNCLLEYDTRLFKRESMQDLISHFLRLTDEVAKGPGQKLADIDIFTPSEELKLAAKREPARSVSLAVSATFTAEPIEEYIRWWGRRFNLDIHTQFAPYNQVFQQLLDEESLMNKNSGVNLLLVRFEDWLREADLPEQEAIKKLRQDFEYLVGILKNKQGTIPWFVGLFPVSTHLMLPAAVLDCLEELTERWQQAVAAITNVYAVDFRRLGALYRIDEVFDPIADKEGHVPFGREFLAAVGTAAARRVCALYNPPFKVIALDCDNTLWQGICGEDGALGVKVEGPYAQLQKFMLARYNEGFLLVLCSKNNEADVWEVFEKNGAMVLKQEHVVAWKINWRPKSENLRELAEELNVGLDSFIFIDDSGVECGEVMANAPEVLSLHLPEEAGSIERFLSHVWAFDKVVVTAEDRGRSRMVRAERRRRAEERESVSLTDFLAGLELKVGLNEMKPGQVGRVSQLTQRTNQFNLSTRRRSEEELLRLSKEPGVRCWVVEVSDRFGDYGLVGVLITRINSESLLIDTFLLSCRVLGRGVEDAVLMGLRRCGEEQGLKCLSADYYATAKNRPVLDFMCRCFNQEAEIEGGIRFSQEVGGIADSLPFMSFYYLEEIDRTEAVDKAADTLSPLPVATAGEPAVGEGHWQIDDDHMERQFHGNHLLPLKNHTARLLLDLPGLGVDEAPSVSAVYRTPGTELERRLLRIWQNILKVEKIGMDTTFFELGGNSLKAVGLVSELHRQFNVELRLRDIFEHKTIAKLAALIDRSEQRVFSSLKSAEKREYYRLSSAQKRIYILHQMEPESTTYNVTHVVEIEGPLNRRKLEESFGSLIGRHESLRTSFFILDDEPVQRIHPGIDFSIEYYDLVVDGIPLTVEGFRGDPGAVDPGMPHFNIVKNFGRAFDLSTLPLLRIGLIRIAQQRHILMVDMHHIISDGLSLDIFVREAAALYTGEELPRLRLQYKDFCEWQADGGVKAALQQQEAYWLGVYEGEIPVLHLPTDYKRPPIRSSAGKSINMTVGRERVLALRDLAAGEGVTPYTVLLSLFYILLARLSGQEEIIVGTVVLGRRHPDLQGMMGMFANMLALRGCPASEKTFGRFLGEVGQTTLAAFENQDYPFDDLVDKISVPRDWSRNPVFDVVFVYQNFGPVAAEKLRLKIKPYWYEDPTSKYDILFEIIEMEESLNLKMEYWPELFKGETIEKYLEYYVRVIDQVVNNRHIRIKDIEILAPQEVHSILARIEQGDRDLVMEFDIN